MNRTNFILLSFFVFALIGAYSIYKPFLLSMIVAMLLTMATFNLTQQIYHKFKSRKLSAFIMSTLLTIIIFVPVIYLTNIGFEYLSQIDKDTLKLIIRSLQNFLNSIPYIGNFAEEYLTEDQLLTSSQDALFYLTSFGKAGLGFLKNMLFVILFYFIINLYSDRVFEVIKLLLPISRCKSIKMINEISSTMEVVFYSTIVTAFLEGLLFGVLVGSFALNGLLLGIIYGFASLVPVIGGALVWAPVAFYVWDTISPSAGWIIIIYSIVVISIIADTFVKPIIIKVIKEDMLKSNVQINELVIFFSILAGMSSYGVWGMILGPAITSFLIAMSRVYIDFNREDLERI
ncbi:Acid membrane antigen A [hydrothermal vent metagenome]|uniref:Acid membrane antigen A n=1 Tax=hydrothermal vent metagenome TaxID=652676 RepID=A0A1W1CA39_9ZZZZ